MVTKKVVIYVTLIVLAAVGLVATYQKLSDWEQSVIHAPGEPVTLQSIAFDYQSNEIAANKKWKGKKVRFTSPVLRIADGNLVLFKAERFTVESSFRVPESEHLARLRSADNVTLDCYGNGNLGLTLYFNNCRVIQPNR